MIYRNNRNQVVAWMNEGKEDFILRKAVDGTEHMLRSPKGWAADKQIIDKAIADGAKEIDCNVDNIYKNVSDGITVIVRGRGAVVLLRIRDHTL